MMDLRMRHLIRSIALPISLQDRLNPFPRFCLHAPDDIRTVIWHDGESIAIPS